MQFAQLKVEIGSVLDEDRKTLFEGDRMLLLIGTHLKPPANGRSKLQGESQPRRLSPRRMEGSNYSN